MLSPSLLSRPSLHHRFLWIPPDSSVTAAMPGMWMPPPKWRPAARASSISGPQGKGKFSWPREGRGVLSCPSLAPLMLSWHLGVVPGHPPNLSPILSLPGPVTCRGHESLGILGTGRHRDGHSPAPRGGRETLQYQMEAGPMQDTDHPHGTVCVLAVGFSGPLDDFLEHEQLKPVPLPSPWPA